MTSPKPNISALFKDNGTLSGRFPTAGMISGMFPPIKLVAYYRVSTEQQGRSGLGLDAQQAAVERFAANERGEILASYTEVETGKGADAISRRPQLAAALEHARKLKCPIVVAKLDRLSRDVHFISGLMADKTWFVDASMGFSADPFMLHIHAAVAEQERRMISQRTRDALARLKAKGVILGNPGAPEAVLLAHAANRLKADKFAMATLPIIWEIQRAGVVTKKGISQALNARGIATVRGNKWTTTGVINVLNRPCVKDAIRQQLVVMVAGQ